ncbi:MAG: hypothetical protein AAB521_01540 [Patescibacteria group bacterium]
MLTKNDLKQIDFLIGKNIDARVPKIIDARVPKIIDARVPKIIDARVPKIIDARVPKIVKDAFQEFYESIFAPYVNKNEKEHAEIVSEVKTVTKRMDSIEDYVKDHDKRIEVLETAIQVKN